MTPLDPGSLLVSNPEMVDPNFEGSVVLLCAHDDAGAMGLTLNRPMELSLAEVLGEEPALALREDAVHWGGPVGLDRLHVLHDLEDEEVLALPVGRSLYFGGDLEVVRRVVETGGRMRFFLGYSGWGEGQLEAELEAGAWRILPPDPSGAWSEIWEAPVARQWERLTGGLDARYGWMKQLPDDPRAN